MPPTKHSFVAAVDQITRTQHTNITPKIDPARTTLPTNFTVCIFEASEGIGAAIAYGYAHAKASSIIISARDTAKLKVFSLPSDVTSAESVESLVSVIEKEVGRLDCVVTAFGLSGPIALKVTDSDPANINTALQVNCLGLYHIARSLIPLLLSSPNGAKAFIAVGSVAGSILTGPIANFAYCTAKMAQARLVEFLAEQYREEGLLAVSVHPGAVMTPTAAKSTPEVFMPYLVDNVGLCGAACVWLTKGRGEIDEELNESEDRSWLSGRLIVLPGTLRNWFRRKRKLLRGIYCLGEWLHKCTK